MGFVGNYAPCGLSPQTNGMPVIPYDPESSLFVLYDFFLSFKRLAVIFSPLPPGR